MSYLLLILLGGPAAMLLPFLVARHLVERHANTAAAVIRQQHACRQLATADRPKELTR